MLEFLKNNLLSIISILISVYAIYQTGKNNEKVQQANNQTHELNKKAQETRELSEKTREGQIELNISTLITNTENRVMDLGIAMSKYFKDNLSETEQKELNFLNGVYNQAIESNLNAYEEACAKYLDEKTDKERFKRMYYTSIRRLIENEDLKSYFPAHSSNYRCILKVYDEWFNLEK